jgi:hypothetical protein
MEEKMMFSCTKDGIQSMQRFFTIAILAVFFCLSLAACSSSTPEQKEFKSPSDAVQAFVAALKKNNEKVLLAILGPGGNEIISSGDEVDDLQARQAFLNAYNEQNSIAPDGDRFLLVIGKNDWPFPIPIIKKGDRWIFDTASGKEELVNRRIGKNELNTIQVMLAIVDAQREFAMKGRDGDSFMEYARKFRSDPGMKNGLYWQAEEGEESSPLGELVADARTEGYTSEGARNKPEPYYGYFYRILTAQGSNAPGGAYDYLVDDKMIGGFAVVAFPAEYANSGVMSFIVNHEGVVYQKDLGENTGEQAKAMSLYDPDETWMTAQ